MVRADLGWQLIGVDRLAIVALTLGGGHQGQRLEGLLLFVMGIAVRTRLGQPARARGAGDASCSVFNSYPDLPRVSSFRRPNAAEKEVRFQCCEEGLSRDADAQKLSIRAARAFTLAEGGFPDGENFACEGPFEAADYVPLAVSFLSALL